MKKYYKYTFICKRIPNRLTMHSLVTHFLGKENICDKKFKIDKVGKLLFITTNEDLSDNFEKTFKDQNGNEILCRLQSKKELIVEDIKKGDVFDISGLIEYGVNITGKKGKKCPYFKGKFESSELRDKFKENIEKSLGCEVRSMSRENFSRLDSDRASVKIQFNNLIEMSVIVEVKNPELFNEIHFKSYFQKKSYGFGNLNFSKINNS